MFRGDLFVTIAEMYTLILDVCVCQDDFETILHFCLLYCLEFIEKAKNGVFYNYRAVKIHKVNLIQNLCS